MIEYSRLSVSHRGEKTPLIDQALGVFVDEIQRRSDVEVIVAAEGELPDITVVLDTDTGMVDGELRDELLGLPSPRSEGYRIATSGSSIAVSGADERGILYGLGRLLRRFEIRRGGLVLPRALRLSSSPYCSLRGHQLGYRPKTNAYDMWTKDHFRQYIRDLAIFGANSIELLPPRTDDEPKTPEMLYDPLEMMAWLSAEAGDLGLDVWIWYPNMSEDFSLEETLARESEEREEVFSRLPSIHAVMIPGGDPGNQEPSVLFEWGRIQSGILKKHHPEAELWISGQIFDATPAWQGAFFRELGREPEWLGGLCHGPWVKGDPAAFRASVPPRYPIRRYPDITHSLSCQYPVRDWDPAWAATLGRECYNPRPLDHKAIHNAYVDCAEGSLSYSEGINDDVNKFIWSDQDWDPSTPVRETLRDYARLFISPDNVEEIGEGLMGFERNWRGPIASNPHVRSTFALWRRLEEELGDLAQSNYRLVLPLVRAYCDEYVRRRNLLELGLESRIVSVLEGIAEGNCAESSDRVRALVEKGTGPVEFTHLKTHCIELADRAFDLIRWQTSVVRHKGQAIVRGAFLDAIDFPITDLPFYAQAVERASESQDPAEQCAVLREALERARPSTSGLFVDLSSVEGRGEVVKDRTWGEDPSGQSIPYTTNLPAPWPSYGKGGKAQVGQRGVPVRPVVERSYVSTFYGKPFTVRLEHLDPSVRYQVRACYTTGRQREGLRLRAGGRMIHDFTMPGEGEGEVCFSLPEGCVTGDGVLELVWQAKPFRVYSEGVAWVIVERQTC